MAWTGTNLPLPFIGEFTTPDNKRAALRRAQEPTINRLLLEMPLNCGVRGSVVGSATAIQAGMSRV